MLVSGSFAKPTEANGERIVKSSFPNKIVIHDIDFGATHGNVIIMVDEFSSFQNTESAVFARRQHMCVPHKVNIQCRFYELRFSDELEKVQITISCSLHGRLYEWSIEPAKLMHFFCKRNLSMNRCRNVEVK